MTSALPLHSCADCGARMFRDARLCYDCQRAQPPEPEVFGEEAHQSYHRSLADQLRREAEMEDRLFELERQSVEPVSVRIARHAEALCSGPINVNPWGELGE